MLKLWFLLIALVCAFFVVLTSRFAIYGLCLHLLRSEDVSESMRLQHPTKVSILLYFYSSAYVHSSRNLICWC
jgi:hypothetical protein